MILKKFIAILSIHSLLFSSIAFSQQAARENTTEFYVDRPYMDGLDTKVTQWMEEGHKNPEATKFLEAIEAAIAQVGKSDVKEMDDPFRLKSQVIEDKSRSENFSLTDPEVRNSLPEYFVNFEADVEVKIDPETKELRFELYGTDKNKKILVATHNFPEVKALKVTQDKEFIQVIDTKGNILTLSVEMAKSSLFKIPTSWVKTGRIPTEIFETIKQNISDVQFEYLARDSRPVVESAIEKGAIIPIKGEGKLGLVEAGDLAIRSKTSDTVYGIYKRKSTWKLYGNGLMILSDMASMIAQNFNVKNGDAPVPNSEKTSREVEVDPRLLEGYADLLKLKKRNIDTLVANGQNNRLFFENAPTADILEYFQWVKDYNKIKDKAESQETELERADEKLKQDWKELIKDDVSTKKTFMQKWGKSMFLLAGLTTFIGVDYGIYKASIGEAPLWGTWLMAKIANIIPEVVFDTSLLYYSMAGAAILYMAIPLIKYVGKIFSQKNGLDPIVTLMTAGLRFRAFFLIPYVVLFSKLTRQRSFTATFNEGLNPNQKITKESELGKRLGLNQDMKLGMNKFFSKEGSKYSEDLERKQRAARGILAEQKNKKNALAWILAATAISDKYNIDEATLFHLFKSGIVSVSAEDLKDPEFKKRWAQSANDIYHSMKELDKLTEREISQVDPKEIVEYYKQAKKIAEASTTKPVREFLSKSWTLFKSAAKLQSTTQQIQEVNKSTKYMISNSYRRMKQRIFLTNTNLEMYNLLKHGKPTQEIANLTYKQFVADYSFSVVQMAFIGARASMDNPTHLAGDPNGLFWTTKAHNVDTIEQVFIYMVPAAAANFLDYQARGNEFLKESFLIDERYQAVEKVYLDGNSKNQKFLESAKEWSMEAFNLHKANYGWLLVYSQLNSILTFRGWMPASLFFMTMGGLSFGSAFLTIIWLKAIAPWFGGILWKMIAIGNLNTQDRLKEDNKRLLKSRTLIAQGINTKDRELVREGYKEMSSLYKDYRHNVTGTESAINSFLDHEGIKDKAKRKEFKELLKDSIGVQLELLEAIKSNDNEKVKKAGQRLRSLYVNQESIESVAEIKDAFELLKYSLENPPLARAYNPAWEYSLFVFGAFVTTLTFSYLFAHALDLEVDAFETFIRVMKLAIPLYAGAYVLQRFGINPVGNFLAKRKETKYENILLTRRVRACSNAFN